MDPGQARHFLRTVDKGCEFYLCNGKVINSLRELWKGIIGLDDAGYRHHVYPDHNDFTNWVVDVIGDEQLAQDLFYTGKQQAAALVRARIHYLEAHR